MTEDNICQICLETNDSPFYTLPECNHKFHTNCIIHWFRSGYNNCPYCNNPGLGNELKKNKKTNTYNYGLYRNQHLLKHIYYYSRRKDAPKELKDLFIKKTEIINDIKLQKNKLKDFRTQTNQDKTYLELKKTDRSLTHNIWKLERKKRDLEYSIVNYNIKPLILVIKKYV